MEATSAAVRKGCEVWFLVVWVNLDWGAPELKCQQYETKTKIITSRVNEHNCLRLYKERKRVEERNGAKVKRKDSTGFNRAVWTSQTQRLKTKHVYLHSGSYTGGSV